MSGSGCYCHTAAGAGRGNAGRPAGPLQGGKLQNLRETAGASGKKNASGTQMMYKHGCLNQIFQKQSKFVLCFLGFFGNSIICGQSGFTLRRSKDCDQAAVGECGQWVDRVPHCQTGLPHGELGYDGEGILF